MRVKVKQAKSKREQQASCSFLLPDVFEDFIKCGYVKLSENGEVQSAINKIADLISSMTIHLISNTSTGDERVKNSLSRFVDINPNPYMTRKNWMSTIINTLLTTGNSVVLPEFERNGYFKSLNPVPEGFVSFIQDGWGYKMMINGEIFEPQNVLHFAINPKQPTPWKGTGYQAQLRPLVDNLAQAQKTKHGFMESKWKPSLVVRVNSDSEALSTEEGRNSIAEQYLKNTNAGAPWIIPTDLIDVKEIKPLSLNDLAINDAVNLDKKTVAAILDVPEFIVGAGSFNKDEWNNFINTRLKPLCNLIEQELTKKLILNQDWYFRFNYRSLFSYDMQVLSTVGANLYTRGIMTGNEVRDLIGLNPREGLDELVILENYIPQEMIGEQKKLNSEGGD